MSGGVNMTIPPILKMSGLVASLCALGACGGGSSTSTDTTSTTTTAGVQCNYSYSALNTDPRVNLTSTASWSCSDTTRTLKANSVPDHAVGPFNIQSDLDFTIKAQSTDLSATITPAVSSTTGTAIQTAGYALNGIKFEPGTGGNCASTATSTDTTTGAACTMLGNAGTWRMEALGQTTFNFGADGSNGHVQPTGEYHYHGMPEKFIDKLGKGTQTMTLVGWASDGFPMYARYGHVEASNAQSDVKVLSSSWRKKNKPRQWPPLGHHFPHGHFFARL